MSIGAISGSYGVDPYEPYRSMMGFHMLEIPTATL